MYLKGRKKMKKEELIALGLEEAVALKVEQASLEELKGFIPKTRFDEVNETKKDLEKQIKDRDTQLTELNKKVKGNEELEKTIKELQDANTATKTEYENKIKEININSAIQAKLTDTKYPDLLSTKFDKTKLSIAADGTVLGIDEQLTTIKETYKDLFVPPVKGRDPENKDKTPPGGKNPWSKEHFNLTQQAKILKENPELAAQLKASV
jgi:vacuolar-type H+-ATPase subunit I/STV1